MFLDPNAIAANPGIIEDIEKGSTRFVTQAIELFRAEAINIFAHESDLQADIGEDITAEALDSLGMSRSAQRVFGKMDYKRARYIFEPNYAVRQILLVDSKAEKNAAGVARIQTSQTSMRIRQVRQAQELDIPGTVPTIATLKETPYLTTTIFVKYVYDETATGANRLKKVIVACIPNGLLQEQYNPTVHETIWVSGPNAPTLGEAFRTRLSFSRLKAKANWRVQTIFIDPAAPFAWDD